MAIDTLAEGVASNLEGAAVATRTINTGVMGGFLTGLVFGASLGFYVGRRFGKEKIKAEAFEVSQREVDNIREFYRANAESDKPVDFHPGETTVVRPPQDEAVHIRTKPSVEEIVEQRGYSTKVSDENEPERPLPPPVPVTPPRRSQGPRSRLTTTPPGANEWNYALEQRQRTPDRPYIIHENEFVNSESGYIKTEYTYYAGDNILVGEDERPVANPDAVVGLDNLRFGHGAQDDDIVFIRNDRLQLEIEISRVAGQYEEEVLGLDTHDSS